MCCHTRSISRSGAIAGNYARVDGQHGTWKAAANETIKEIRDLELCIADGQQKLLNPAGTNVLRFFDKKGFVVWGSRTIPPEPEWKYHNVRRCFLFLELSIEQGTQWVAFAAKDANARATVRNIIEVFLIAQWKSGHSQAARQIRFFKMWQ